MKHSKNFIVLLLALYSPILVAYNVGLIIVATGRYIQFVPPLIESANKHFCRNHNVMYFILTDAPTINMPNVVTIYQKKLGWPYDTMMRPGMYFENAALFETMDYLFSCDADMLFVNAVGDEILSERVATMHPGYVGQRGTYETNPVSRAYIAPHEGKHYFAGGLWGGSRKEFLKMAQTINQNVTEDLKRNHIAVWHDESHVNRYFVDNPPTLILSPSYCYPESLKIPYTKRLLALDKNHAVFQR